MVSNTETADVIILGGGLAGLTLARQILLQTELSVLQLDKSPELPRLGQKIGESTVQVGGYYLSRVLELEEYLVHKQVMKYNLRFYWPTTGRNNDDILDYSQGYIRKFSNIPTYQIDRNQVEAKLIELNLQNRRYRLRRGAGIQSVLLGEAGSDHRVSFTLEGSAMEAVGHWVIDATGVSRFLTRQLKNRKACELRHGASYFWVDGTVNLERLSRTPYARLRAHPFRRDVGHSPFWMATNHFSGPGYWLWVIPLPERTSFGLVYDEDYVDPEDVTEQAALKEWICQHIPVLAPVLAEKEMLEHGSMRRYAYDCSAILSADRWALTGISGRFSDPLYSPGSDLMAMQNSFILECLKIEDPKALASHVSMFNRLHEALFSAFLPSYRVSYGALGDQEAFTLKYAWELAIYFGFYVFPFVNEHFSDRLFIIGFFRRFARLGPANLKVQNYVQGLSQWKARRGNGNGDPRYFDFSDLEPLARAELCFYEVGHEPEQALRILDQQLESLEEFARFILAHIESRVAGAPELMDDANFVAEIVFEDGHFDEAAILERARQARERPDRKTHTWSFCDKKFQRTFCPTADEHPVSNHSRPSLSTAS